MLPTVVIPPDGVPVSALQPSPAAADAATPPAATAAATAPVTDPAKKAAATAPVQHK
jgi:hypothetical protein